jgi:hypothetical protein
MIGTRVYTLEAKRACGFEGSVRYVKGDRGKAHRRLEEMHLEQSPGCEKELHPYSDEPC